MNTESEPIVEVQMLIRKPVSIVYQAFIDPAITTNFWFTKSSGKLEPGKKVVWEWEMYGISTNVNTRSVEENKQIVIEWGEPYTLVNFEFNKVNESQTYLIIKQSAFNKTGSELIQIIKDSTGGFTTVIDGLKAYLEHGIKLNLIADKFPPALSNHGKK